MKMRVVENGIGDWFQRSIAKSEGSSVRGWLNRVAYPEIINAQLRRWQSEGASEGEKWQALNPAYARSKLKRFADYPGGGRKMLIATGRLVDSMTGRSEEGRKIVQETKLTIVSTVPYGEYVDEVRDITSLSEKTVDRLIDSLIAYLVGA